MNCNNKAEQTVPSGFDYKVIEVNCGSTGIHGDAIYCNSCNDRFENSNRHPDYCKHGTYLYPEHGGDAMCFACEQGE